MLPVLKSFSQDARVEVVNSFLKAVADSGISPNVIYDNFLCKSNKPISSEHRSIILQQIEELTKKITPRDTDSYSILKYKQLPKAEHNILVNPTMQDDVFIVKQNDREIVAILVSQNKIRSFVTITKGGLRTFLLLC